MVQLVTFMLCTFYYNKKKKGLSTSWTSLEINLAVMKFEKIKIKYSY